METKNNANSRRNKWSLWCQIAAIIVLLLVIVPFAIWWLCELIKYLYILFGSIVFKIIGIAGVFLVLHIKRRSGLKPAIIIGAIMIICLVVFGKWCEKQPDLEIRNNSKGMELVYKIPILPAHVFADGKSIKMYEVLSDTRTTDTSSISNIYVIEGYDGLYSIHNGKCLRYRDLDSVVIKNLNSATLQFNIIYKSLSNKKLPRILPCQIFHLS